MSAARRRRWVLGLAALVLVALVAMMLRPRPIAVEVGQVERGPLQVTLDEEGETRVQERYVVSSPLAGKVLRIELEPGDAVVAEESILATFRPSEPVPLDARAKAEAEAAVSAAQAALGSAQTNVVQTMAELEFRRTQVLRVRRLNEDGIVSDGELDQAELAVETAQEAVEAAEFAVGSRRSELAAARARLLETDLSVDEGGTLDLRSPVNGRVLRLLRESESVVPAGEPLLEIGDPRELEIVSDFLSSDAVRIEEGDPVLIERWGGDAPLHGRVQRVEPSGFTKISALGVEEQRVNVIIDLEAPVSERRSLGDGYRVEVRVVVWEQDDVTVVPSAALFRERDEWAVYVVDAGDRARRRAVELGERSAEAAQVVSGLEVGDQVILHPGTGVEDGRLVEAIESVVGAAARPVSEVASS